MPADIGLAQVILESGLSPTRRSEANAVGFCQWLRKNWKRLDAFSPVRIDGNNQTTQAPYCAAYLSILATKYGSFIPALSEHNAGGTNVGRTLITGERLGGDDVRSRYFLGSRLAQGPARPAGQGIRGRPWQLRPSLVSLRGDGVRQHVHRQSTADIDDRRFRFTPCARRARSLSQRLLRGRICRRTRSDVSIPRSLNRSRPRARSTCRPTSASSAATSPSGGVLPTPHMRPSWTTSYASRRARNAGTIRALRRSWQNSGAASARPGPRKGW